MATLTNEERECHFNMTADNRNVWEVFTDDPIWITRLDKIATAYKETDNAKWYRLGAGQVSVRKMLTDEQRANRAKNLVKRTEVPE